MCIPQIPFSECQSSIYKHRGKHSDENRSERLLWFRKGSWVMYRFYVDSSWNKEQPLRFPPDIDWDFTWGQYLFLMLGYNQHLVEIGSTTCSFHLDSFKEMIPFWVVFVCLFILLRSVWGLVLCCVDLTVFAIDPCQTSSGGLRYYFCSAAGLSVLLLR